MVKKEKKNRMYENVNFTIFKIFLFYFFCLLFVIYDSETPQEDDIILIAMILTKLLMTCKQEFTNIATI